MTAGKTKRRYWTEAQVAKLRALYPDMPTAKLARLFRRKVRHVYNKALHLGLKKSAAFMASDASGRLTKLAARGRNYRFKKGQVPWNKGLHYQPGGRIKESQFKPGQKPWTWHPIGHERVTKEGILQRKVTDTRYTPRDYRAVHVLVWEKHHKRKVPKGRIVVFKDGNRRNFDPKNLECITRAENMRRNSYHTRLPKAVARLIQLKGALQRQINRRTHANH